MKMHRRQPQGRRAHLGVLAETGDVLKVRGTDGDDRRGFLLSTSFDLTQLSTLAQFTLCPSRLQQHLAAGASWAAPVGRSARQGFIGISRSAGIGASSGPAASALDLRVDQAR